MAELSQIFEIIVFYENAKQENYQFDLMLRRLLPKAASMGKTLLSVPIK